MLSLLASAVLARADWYPIRWFYVQVNLAVEANTQDLLRTMNRAQEAGYNGMVITDSKFSILENMGKNYFDNVAKVRERAAKLGFTVTPAVAEVGYAGGLLSHNVNLIEGQPVKKAPFVVKDGALQPVREVTFANAGLEEATNDRLAGFTYQDGPNTISFSDTTIKHGGSRSLRFENVRAGNTSGNARIMHGLTVRPWNQYRVKFWLKTDGLANAGEVRCFAMGEGGKVLSFMDVGAKPTQDWTEHTVVFNSQSFEKVTLYTGLWGGTIGKFWLDDFSVEEAGFLNVLRRSGTPVRLETEAGKLLDEGKEFDRVEDSKLGTTPWPGEYTFTQVSPLVKTRLAEGTKVMASYSHAVATEQGKTAICPSEPETQAVLADQFRRVAELWKPKGLFLAHDEIRVANQCPLCQSHGMAPGQLFALNLRQCVELSKRTVPGGMMLVWSDMFDPYHNAVDNYYLSNGSWKDAPKGVTSDVTIMNWNAGNAAKSLSFFAGLGCKQILSGFYDAPISEFQKWRKGAEGVKGIEGVMYTTWVGDYSHLEEFANVAFKRN